MIPFVLAVTLGNHVITVVVKDLADRARPTLNPIAADASARRSRAATRRRRRRSTPAPRCCSAAAAGTSRAPSWPAWPSRIAVAVALHAACCSTCTGLSDVIAGLCLGWAWFAVCAIAFGGRLLRFGAAAEQAEDAARAATGAAPVKV